MRCQPVMLAKGTNQVGARQTARCADICQAQRIAAMSAYERCCRVQPWVAFVTDTGIGAEKVRQ